MNTIVDVAIGVIVLYLLLALIVTTVQELISSLLHLRAKHLYHTLEGMLAGTVAGITPSTSAQQLLHAFYEHPLVRNLTSRAPSSLKGALSTFGRGLPSYIPSRTFALALLDALRGTNSAADTIGASQLLASSRDLAQKVSDPDLQRILTLLLSDAELVAKDFNERSKLVSERLETWFNDRMARAAGTYKRYAQLWSLGLALVITIVFNADTLHITSQLWTDTALRTVVLASATALNDPALPSPDADLASELLRQADLIARSGLPVGWRASSAPHALSLVGWAITALAVSLGASFWFDMLSKALRLRGTGARVSAITGRVEAKVTP
jgi:hypothetical protein